MFFSDIPKIGDWKQFTGRGPAPSWTKIKPAPPPAEILKLDEMIQRYAQVMTMARINVLYEMYPLVTGWVQTAPKPAVNQLAPSTGGLYEAMQALKEVVARKLKQIAPNASPYNQVVCVGYSVETGTIRDIAAAYKAQWGVDKSGGAYVGLNDPKTDMTRRCQQMIKGIQQAYALHQHVMVAGNRIVDNAKTLKIFMAPEFFFRGKAGAFSTDHLIGSRNQESLLDRLRKETGDGKYTGWLFVLGTFIAASERSWSSCGTCNEWMENQFVPSLGRKQLTCPTCKKQLLCDNPTCRTNPKTKGSLITLSSHPAPRRYGCPICNKPGNFYEHIVAFHIDNFALVQKGGYPAGDGVHDYITEKAAISNLDFDVVDAKAPKRKLFGQEHELTSAGQDAPATNTKERMGGAVFTMDAITYGLEVCLDHLSGRLAADPDRGAVKIQLVPSAGAHITPGSVACAQNGIVFNVDGGGGARISVAVNSSSGLAGQNPLFDLGVPIVDPGLFPPGSQKVQIFGPFAMPA